jgi:hypothetical protein
VSAGWRRWGFVLRLVPGSSGFKIIAVLQAGVGRWRWSSKAPRITATLHALLTLRTHAAIRSRCAEGIGSDAMRSRSVEESII